jgi:hypothetical protein
VTPLRLLLADQFRLPCEFGVSINVPVQDIVVQELPVEFDILDGMTVDVGSGGGGGCLQLHITFTVLLF